MSDFLKVIEESNRARLHHDIEYQERQRVRRQAIHVLMQEADDALDGRKQRYKKKAIA